MVVCLVLRQTREAWNCGSVPGNVKRSFLMPVLERSKCPLNIVTLQAEKTTQSQYSTGHQSPSDMAPLTGRTEILKAPWKKPTSCNDCSLLQSTQTSSGTNQPPFQCKIGLLPQD